MMTLYVLALVLELGRVAHKTGDLTSADGDGCGRRKGEREAQGGGKVRRRTGSGQETGDGGSRNELGDPSV